MAKNPESPVEPFKRALAHAARSLAEKPDLEIVYSGEGPQLSGNRAVLPHPPRDLTPADAARIRGLADQMALRLAHHDVATHAKGRPASALGAPVYDALEQARIEAVGANALGGVKNNLRAVHEHAWAKKPLNQLEALANPPMADVVALLARERMTGEPPPAMARPLVDLFRADVEAKAGADLDRLAEAAGDQKAFARIARDRKNARTSSTAGTWILIPSETKSKTAGGFVDRFRNGASFDRSAKSMSDVVTQSLCPRLSTRKLPGLPHLTISVSRPLLKHLPGRSSGM